MLPTLSLEPILTCPNCGRPHRGIHVQRGIGFPQCHKCNQRWWAMLIQPGPVVPQLAREFEDEAVAVSLVTTYHLPIVLYERSFWQIMLHAKEMHEHRESSPLMLFRSMLLLPNPC